MDGKSMVEPHFGGDVCFCIRCSVGVGVGEEGDGGGATLENEEITGGDGQEGARFGDWNVEDVSTE